MPGSRLGPSRACAFALSQCLPRAPRHSHRPLDVRIVRVLVEEQHDLAARALARISVLQPLGPVAKDVLAARATDLDRIFHDNSSIDSERRRSEGLLLKMTIDREITEHADL